MTVQFMADWNFAASSDCRNNPVDISHAMGGATNCKRLTSSRQAKNYTSHAQAATAFSRELHSGSFPDLLKALATSNPYSYSNPDGVVADLKLWGSPKQAAYYAKFATGGSGGGSGGGSSSVDAPKGHKGFRDFQTALAHTLPTATRRSRIIRERALRKLGAPSSLR